MSYEDDVTRRLMTTGPRFGRLVREAAEKYETQARRLAVTAVTRPRGWRGEVCRDCGHHMPIGYHVPNEMWEKVVGEDIRLCITCFDTKAAALGVDWDQDIELFPVSTQSWIDW